MTRSFCALAVALGFFTQAALAGGPSLPTSAKANECISRGLTYLLSSQDADGAWQASGQPHPSITALAVKCIADSPSHGPRHDAARRGMEYVLRFVQPDGGIYRPDDNQPNYQTSVALMALASMRDDRYEGSVRNAQQFLRKLQWDEGEGHEQSSAWYGGAGYGKHKRPDLSNTQLMIEALHDSGLPKDDPVYRKALQFISRSQNLDATNDQAFANGANDGGFVYTPANDGESMAGAESVDGARRLRSYGSMTYAAFKSMLYADVQRDDPRVKAALAWIRRNYTLEVNPNMPAGQSREGLFYYFHTFARALHAWGEGTIVDDRGVPHDWRDDLTGTLATLQRPDGSWVNESDRWFEGNPHLATAYSVLALETVLAPSAAPK